MVQILPRADNKSFGQRLSGAIGAGLDEGQDLYDKYQKMQEQKKQRESFRELMGPEGELYADQPQEFQKLALQNKFQKELEGMKLAGKNEENKFKMNEKIQPYLGALKSVDDMIAIRKKGNLGIGSKWSLFPETMEDVGAYETLGKSLIQFASTVPIRNQKEFETLSHDLYDPTITDAKAKGILSRLRNIIIDSMQHEEDELLGNEMNVKDMSKGRRARPLADFEG